eukprot:COSAG05_NODE_2627_length_2825_cov_14.816214_1_plen_310_part_00
MIYPSASYHNCYSIHAEGARPRPFPVPRRGGQLALQERRGIVPSPRRDSIRHWKARGAELLAITRCCVWPAQVKYVMLLLPSLLLLVIPARDAHNPLAGLPALKKTHYSWPLPLVSSTWLGGAEIDFARITGSLPLWLYSDCGTPDPTNNTVGQNRSEVFEAVKICHLASSTAPPVLALNWSPWYSCFEAPGGREVVMGDPRVRGAEESNYLAEWRARLLLYKDWVAEANALFGSRVRIGAAVLDSERFWFNCSEHSPWGTAGHPGGPYHQYCSANASFNHEWFDSITRKHDLTTELVRSVFGASIDIE